MDNYFFIFNDNDLNRIQRSHQIKSYLFCPKLQFTNYLLGFDSCTDVTSSALRSSNRLRKNWKKKETLNRENEKTSGRTTEKGSFLPGWTDVQ